MAHKICEMLDKMSGKKPEICDKKCKYWRFPNRYKPCVLSDVYSVLKGEPCFIKELKHVNS